MQSFETKIFKTHSLSSHWSSANGFYAQLYKKVPEQTSPKQAREESGGEEQEVLDKVASRVAAERIDVTSRLVYTPDLSETLDNYAEDNQSQAILTPAPVESLERLLVPIYHSDQVNLRLTTILRDLALSSGLPVTLLVLESREPESEQETELEALQRLAIQQLLRTGLSQDQIRSNRVDVADLADAIEQVAGEKDLVILSEFESDARQKLFTTLLGEIRESMPCSTLVILRKRRED